MIRVRFQTQTNKHFDLFQKDLEFAISQSVAAAVTMRTWAGRTLHTIAPAAKGFITFDSGTVQAEVSIYFPALHMRRLIENETRNILAAASGNLVITQ